MPLKTPILVLLFLVTATARAAEGESVWVSVDFLEPSTAETHYYLAQVPRAALAGLSAASPAPALLRLERVCFYDLDDRGVIRGIIEYEDERETGIVYLPVARILQLVELPRDPHELVVAPVEPTAGATTIP